MWRSYRIINLALLLGAAVIAFPHAPLAQTAVCVPSPYGCPGDSGPADAPSPEPAPVYRPPAVQSPAQRAIAEASRINNAGLVIERRGNYVGALAKYRQALRINPSDTTIRVNVVHVEAKMLIKRGDYAAAVAKLREGLAFVPQELSERLRSDIAAVEAALAKQQSRVSQQKTEQVKAAGQRLTAENISGAVKKYCDLEEGSTLKATLKAEILRFLARNKKFAEKFDVRRSSVCVATRG